MPADYRHLGLFIEIDGMHDAVMLAQPTPDAFFGFKQYAAAIAFNKGIAGAKLHASGIKATKAHDNYEPACHPAGSAHHDRALVQRMVLLIDRRTNVHACETTKAFVNVFESKYFLHMSLPLFKCKM